MKKLNAIFAILGLVFILNACAPEENVEPQPNQENLERFDVKSEHEDGTTKPGGK